MGLPPSLWPLVYRLAGGRGWPPESPEAAARLVQQADAEGLVPLLFDDTGLPGSVRAALEAQQAWRRLYQRRSEILERAAADLARILEGEPVVLLKGADYRRRLYARPELRPMQDLDLLVPRERIDAVVERLARGGLQPRFPGGAATRVASHHERTLVLGDVTVEVHHSFVQRARHRVDYEAVWTRRVPLAAWAPGAARLEDADALAYHALSMAVDEFSVPLIRYVDLWLMLESAPPALAAAAERARAWQAVRALYGALRQLFLLFPESRTGERAAVAQGLLGRPLRLFLDRLVLPRLEAHGKGKNMSRRVELWRKLCLLDNTGRRIRFGLYHAASLAAGRLGAWRRTIEGV